MTEKKRKNQKLRKMFLYYGLALIVCIWIDWRIFLALLLFGAGMNTEKEFEIIKNKFRDE